MPLLSAFAVAAVLAAAPQVPTESMYPAEQIVRVLPLLPWCSDRSQFTFQANGVLEMKALGEAGDKPGGKATGSWSMQGAKVRVTQPGTPPSTGDLVALRDRNFGMVLGYAGQYWGPCE